MSQSRHDPLRAWVRERYGLPAARAVKLRAGRRRAVKIAGGLAAVAAAGVMAAAGLAWWQGQQLLDELQAGAKQGVVDAVSRQLGVAPARPAPGIKDAITILAIGADRRKGERGHGRSDTMMLVRVDPDAGTVSVLNLPRDLRVPIPGHGEDKLNSAYSYGGAPLAVATIRDWLGVTIDHFVLVDFRGFRELIDSLGGAWIPVDQRYYHVNDGTEAGNWSSIDLHPGYQRLSGAKALEFVRFRHLDSDFVRAARQQVFLRELGRQIRAQMGGISAVSAVLEPFAKATTSDISSLPEALQIARTLWRTRGERIARVTMAAAPKMIGGVFYLTASPADKQAALRAWSEPRVKPPPAGRPAARRDAAAAAGTHSDGGEGRRLALAAGLQRAGCLPARLPDGFQWGSEEPARRYRLHGQWAASMHAVSGPGESVLWMFTDWQDPPILDGPSDRMRAGRRSVDVRWEAGKVRMVSFRARGQQAWITNTLGSTLSLSQMLALAASCR